MQDYIQNKRYEQYPVAMAYVPWQKDSKMYENLGEAFKIGTIFPELNKPFTGRRPKT
ncbi:MAG: spore coat associated protein CotJA [Lachnospiraceae bacterium]|nr:spore coat associated protein CotJA [Lachnospiraceae bacterium]